MVDTASPVKLTERDMSLAAAAWQCLKSEPQIDYDKLAAICGFKNKGSAAASLRPVLKKLKLLVPGSPAMSTTGVKRKTSATLAGPAPSTDEATDVESPLARKRVKNEARPETVATLPKKEPTAIKSEVVGGAPIHALPLEGSFVKGAASTAVDLGGEQGDQGEFKMEDLIYWGEDTVDEGV